MILFIMTRGRVGRQETIKWIPDQWRHRTFLVCPEEEAPKHGHPCLVQPPHVTNYSQKFQWLLEYPSEKIVIMDDDVFFSRREGAKLRSYKEAHHELNELWSYMEELLEDTALVGVHPRQMGHIQPLPFVRNSKIICIQGVNLGIVKAKLGLIPRVDFFPILSDQIFAMTLLSNGIENKLITTFCQDHGPSQAPGGCDYRTLEMQREAVEYIANTFGPHATMEMKRPKVSKWLGDERPDLRVQWKRMYAAGADRVQRTGTIILPPPPAPACVDGTFAATPVQG